MDAGVLLPGLVLAGGGLVFFSPLADAALRSCHISLGMLEGDLSVVVFLSLLASDSRRGGSFFKASLPSPPALLR